MRYGRCARSGKASYGAFREGGFELLDAAPWSEGRATGQRWDEGEFTVLAPCLPGKIIGVAMNYPGVSGECPEMTEPLVFMKSASCVIGPSEPIRCPFPSAKVWGEPEIALVIGAERTIFGHTIANDVTAANLNNWDDHLARSKCADSFCPMGPWIDTAFDASSRSVEGFQNGRLLRKGVASERKWSDLDLVAMLSQWITLQAGDVILTGCPKRTGERAYLGEDDVFSCRVEGLGELSNRFTSK